MEDINFWYVVLVLAILLAVVYAVRSFAKRLSGGCCGSSGSENVKRVRVSDKNPEHYPYAAVLTIDGMVCGGCTTRVENALNTLEGVWAKADLSQRRAVVRMKREVDDADLRAAVNELKTYTVLKIERPVAGKRGG